MNKQPLVTTITPFYNSQLHLKSTIESALSQTYKNFELILVDDGSKDDSLVIAKSFKDKRIKIFRQENQGQCVATNVALREAQGEYIQFLDSDDIMAPDKTENQMNSLMRCSGSALGVSKWAFFHGDVREAAFSDEPVFRSSEPVDWLCSLWSHDTMMHTNSYLIPRAVLTKGGQYFDESLTLNVDFEFFTRMTLASDHVDYCDSALGYYRKGVKGSKTYSASMSKQRSALKARVTAIRNLLQKENSERTRSASRMALTLLTFSYPALLPEAKIAVKELKLTHFADFRGRRFGTLVDLLGFEHAVRVRGVYSRFL